MEDGLSEIKVLNNTYKYLTFDKNTMKLDPGF